MTDFNLTGTGTVTKSAESGKALSVVAVFGYWRATGQSGTMRLKEGSTTVWDAQVSGGIYVNFPSPWEFAANESMTLELSGAYLRLIGTFPA